MRVLKDAYNVEWEEKRRVEMHDLQGRGIVPVMNEIDQLEKNPQFRPLLLGQALGGIKEQLPAAEILNSMVTEAAGIIKGNHALLLPSKM